MRAVGHLADALLARLVPHAVAHACAIATRTSGGVAAETCTSKKGKYICYQFCWPSTCYGGWQFYACA